jgi:hypothetical protein
MHLGRRVRDIGPAITDQLTQKIVTRLMLQPCAWFGKYQLTGRSGAYRAVASPVASAPSAPGHIPGCRAIVPSPDRGTDMLAVAAAAHGQANTQILLILAVVALAMFWRAAIKIALALIVIGFVTVVAKGDTTLIHGLHAMIP